MLTAPIRIEIPAHDGSLKAPPPCLTNSTPSPQKTPEDLAQRDAKNKMIHDIHIEAVAARAKRANERVKDSVARKLRLEAFKVDKASKSIERANSHVDAQQEEVAAKREAVKVRRQILFDSVRETRRMREFERQVRKAALSTLEEKALATRARIISATVNKGRATVQHAIAVAAAQKLKTVEQAAFKELDLRARLYAAEQRRLDLLESTCRASPPSGKVRLTKLQEEKHTLEERRVRFASSMGGAIGRRAARIDGITMRTAAENARVAEVASGVKLERELAPAAKKHSLVVRMQAAQVNRLTVQQAKADAIAAISAGLPFVPSNIGMTARSTPSSPTSPAKTIGNSLASMATASIWRAAKLSFESKILSLGPDGGYGRGPPTPTAKEPKELWPKEHSPTYPTSSEYPRHSPTSPATLSTMGQTLVHQPALTHHPHHPRTKRPVSLFFPAFAPTAHERSLAPPAALLSRLLCVPRLQLATAKARHCGAAARRVTKRAIIVAKAVHFGTVRVAQAQVRRCARAELAASACRMREERGARTAQVHLLSIVATARKASHRAMKAAMNRSTARLQLLNLAIVAEERRQNAAVHRNKRLLDIMAGRYEKAAAVAARARCAGLDASQAVASAAAIKRCKDAETRRSYFLEYKVAKARAYGAISVPRIRGLRVRSARTEPPLAPRGKKLGTVTFDPKLKVCDGTMTFVLKTLDLARRIEQQNLEAAATAASAKPLNNSITPSASNPLKTAARFGDERPIFGSGGSVPIMTATAAATATLAVTTSPAEALGALRSLAHKIARAVDIDAARSADADAGAMESVATARFAQLAHTAMAAASKVARLNASTAASLEEQMAYYRTRGEQSRAARLRAAEERATQAVHAAELAATHAKSAQAAVRMLTLGAMADAASQAEAATAQVAAAKDDDAVVRGDARVLEVVGRAIALELVDESESAASSQPSTEILVLPTFPIDLAERESAVSDDDGWVAVLAPPATA